jgi:hypothetical protein
MGQFEDSKQARCDKQMNPSACVMQMSTQHCKIPSKPVHDFVRLTGGGGLCYPTKLKRARGAQGGRGNDALV